MNHSKPFQLLQHGRSARLLLAFSLVLLLQRWAAGQPAPLPTTEFWLTDGPIHAAQIVDGTIYLGGDFSYAGPRTGPAAVFDSATGEYLGRFPRVNGAIYAVEPDGTGGWYIGGEFTKIEGVSSVCVAHVLPDLGIDRAFDAKITGSAIYALARAGDRLFAGGQFTKVAGVSRRGLVALEPATGALVSWNPEVAGRVNSVIITNGVIYAAGSFTSVGTSPRNNVAAITLDTAKATSWNPGADNQVFALAVAPDAIYLGGQFTTAGGKPRSRLAAIDPVTGSALNWIPNPSGVVRALALSDDTLFVGGDFTTISVQSRNKFAALNRSSGAALPLDLQIEGAGSQVLSIRVLGSDVYVCGNFARAQNMDQPMIAAANFTTGTAVETLPLGSLFHGAQDNALVTCLATDSGRTVFAGDYESLGGVRRTNAAALSESTGAVLPWSPTPSSPVEALACSADAVYIAGAFTNMSGKAQNGLAAVDRITGTNLSQWIFTGSNGTGRAEIRAVLLAGNRLYIGGLFTAAGSKTVRMLSALNPTNGEALNFDAKITGGSQGVTALALAGDKLVFAGDFSAVGGQARSRLAAVSTANAQVDPWNPGPNQTVSCLASTADRLYVGGLFTRISSVDIRQLAVFEVPTLNLSLWDAAISKTSTGVKSIVAAGPALYIGGTFDSIGGDFRANAACLRVSTALACEWDPAPNQAPSAVSVSEKTVLLVGGFRSTGRSATNAPAGYLAAYHRGPVILTNAISAGQLMFTATTGDRTRALIESSGNLVTWKPVATNEVSGFIWNSAQPIQSTGGEYFRVVAE